MNQETRQALEKFAVLDTLYSGHWADKERFLNFIVTAFRNKEVKITYSEFMVAIKEIRNGQNINDEALHNLYCDYENALDVLNYYERGSI